MNDTYKLRILSVLYEHVGRKALELMGQSSEMGDWVVRLHDAIHDHDAEETDPDPVSESELAFALACANWRGRHREREDDEELRELFDSFYRYDEDENGDGDE